jgi:hypothetical protein
MAIASAAALARLGGPALAQAAMPKRLPLGEFARDPRLVAALRRGVQVMRSRPGSDPGSWFWQGAVHAYNDEIYGDAVLRDAGVAGVDADTYWNQCPHFGQSSANFVIWHRAYLYHFERILRAAAAEPELAVPYWNYDSMDQRAFPALFAPQFLDADRRIPNSLYHRNRELAFVSGRYTLSEPVCAASNAREAPQFFSEPGVTGFGGDLLAGEETRPGAIEQQPHNDLHVAVGGMVGSNNGAMADVPTAAFDPIFWVHHANIDRLWREWAASPGKIWGPLPPDEWFDEAPWTFIDADGSEVRKPRRFYIDADNLSTAYAGIAAQGGLSLPTVQGNRAPARLAQARNRALFSNNATVAVAANAPATRVAVANGSASRPPPPPVTAMPDPQDAVGRGRRPAAAARRSARAARVAAAPAPSLTVRLSGIRYDRLPASGFAVYLAPHDAALTENSAWFLGTVNLFGAGGGPEGQALHQAHHADHQDFDATRLLDRLESERLEVRIVPYALLAPNGGATAPRDDGIRIAQISLLIGE